MRVDLTGHDGETAGELATIAAIAAQLNVEGIAYWVTGGWAVDLHLGRVRRPHSGIDVAAYRSDRPAIGRTLARLGLASTEQIGVAVELFTGRRRVEVTYVERGVDGALVEPRYEDWPYVADALGRESVTLNGIEVSVMTIAGLLGAKLEWQRQSEGPPRPHDVADVDALRSLQHTRARRRQWAAVGAAATPTAWTPMRARPASGRGPRQLAT